MRTGVVLGRGTGAARRTPSRVESRRTQRSSVECADQCSACDKPRRHMSVGVQQLVSSPCPPRRWSAMAAIDRLAALRVRSPANVRDARLLSPQEVSRLAPAEELALEPDVVAVFATDVPPVEVLPGYRV